MVDHKSWPHLIDTDDLSKRKLQAVYRAPTAEMICYLDFSVSTTGMLAGIKVRLGTLLPFSLWPVRPNFISRDEIAGLTFQRKKLFDICSIRLTEAISFIVWRTKLI